jgi:hypothetical protein
MKYCCLFLFLGMIVSCTNHSKSPDVSNISIPLEWKRFDRDFFTIDSNNTKQGLEKLTASYPDFTDLFVGDILGLGRIADSNQLVYDGTKRFLHLNQKLYDTVQVVFKNTNDLEQSVNRAFQYVKHYFPGYELPSKIYTVLGPMDALPPLSNGEPSPNFMGKDFLAISLQFYLGRSFSIYNDPNYAATIVPQFRSRRFSKEYITADVLKLVIDDLYPDNSSRLPLVERFVEKGKWLYLLQNFLPDTNDSLLIGYTGKQLNWCKENERTIFNFFTQQNLLYEIDPALTQSFLNDGPFTQGMPQESPGNIGAFVGWSIVRAYLKKNPGLSTQQLLTKPAKEIFNGSAYKPR